MRQISLDEWDQQILARLQTDSRTVAETIGADVGLSPAAVQRRIKRLRTSGVISRDVVVINPAALGLAMTFVVGVQLERERADVLDDFRRQMRADDQVQQCYYVTGEHDFLLIVTGRDMTDFEAFTRRALFDNPHIRRFTTSVVMDRVKTGQTLPIRQAESDPPQD